MFIDLTYLSLLIDPIVKDERGLLQLNTYRPNVELVATPPDTPKVKQHIEDFKELIKKTY